MKLSLWQKIIAIKYQVFEQFYNNRSTNTLQIPEEFLALYMPAEKIEDPEYILNELKDVLSFEELKNLESSIKEDPSLNYCVRIRNKYGEFQNYIVATKQLAEDLYRKLKDKGIYVDYPFNPKLIHSEIVVPIGGFHDY